MGKDTNDDFNIDDDYKYDTDNENNNGDKTKRKDKNKIIEDIIEQYRSKDGHICDLFLDVSKDNLSDRECYALVRKISNLDNHYRFNYAIMYSIINNIYKNTGLEVLETMRINSEHLESFIKDNDEYFKKHRKFIQYLQMEIGRKFDYEMQAEELRKKLDIRYDIDEKLQQLGMKEELLEEKLIKNESRLDNQQLDYIAILSVFSAIVLGFTGEFTFSSSIMDNIASTSIYRLMIISILLSFGIINATYFLLWYVGKLIFKVKEKNVDNKERIKYGIPSRAMTFSEKIQEREYLNNYTYARYIDKDIDNNKNKKKRSTIYKINVFLAVLFIFSCLAGIFDIFKVEENINKKLKAIEKGNVQITIENNDKSDSEKIKKKKEPKATDKPKTTQKSKEKENKDK